MSVLAAIFGAFTDDRLLQPRVPLPIALFRELPDARSNLADETEIATFVDQPIGYIGKLPRVGMGRKQRKYLVPCQSSHRPPLAISDGEVDIMPCSRRDNREIAGPVG